MSFNAEDYINDLLSQTNFLPPDTQIDDREIPEAKNCIEFFHDSRFLGNMLPTKLFPRQAEIFIKLFSDYCPRCSDMDYLMGSNIEKGISDKIAVNESFDKMFDKIQLLEYGVCPRCGATRSELYLNNEIDPHTELTLLLGQRAGKSASTSMVVSYTIHKFLKVPNLQRTYNLLPSSPFIIPLVAMSFEKAKLLLYNALYEYLTKGNWFKQYHEFIADQQASLGIKEDLCTVKDTFARYRHKNILIAPFGPDKRKLRGNTSISAACLTGDTLINTNNGLLTIKEITENFKQGEYQVFSDGKLSNIIEAKFTGNKECLKITLENGQYIKASLEHPFILGNSLVKAKDLKINDKLYYEYNLGNYIEIPISFIEDISIQPVYNLTIDSKSHIYAANGILQHNCDEIGWMIGGTSDGIKFNADEIYASINNSLMTAKEAYLKLLQQGYNNLPPPINCNLSSPSSKKDKICRLYEDSKHDRFMYGAHLATWEVNPNLPLDGPTMQALKRKNEREFWRDFGAVPPNSSSAFFSSPELFEDCYQGNNICKIKKLHHLLRDQEFTYGKLIVPRAESQKPNRILAMDAGVVNNSFAFAIAHIVDTKEFRYPVFDALVEIIPDDQAPLNYSKIYDDVIKPMIEQLNIKLVCTDRWQNLKILSDIENDKKLKCQTKQYSVKYSDFLDFRQAVYDNHVKFPKPELKGDDIERAGNDSYPYGFEDKPVSHFIFQALTVVDMMGKTVAKGEGLTDDLFRAAVLGYSIILRDEYKNLFKGSLSGGTRGGIGAIPGGNSGGFTSRIGAIPGGSFRR